VTAKGLGIDVGAGGTHPRSWSTARERQECMAHDHPGEQLARQLRSLLVPDGASPRISASRYGLLRTFIWEAKI